MRGPQLNGVAGAIVWLLGLLIVAWAAVQIVEALAATS
jgi:hypothetical protein